MIIIHATRKIREEILEFRYRALICTTLILFLFTFGCAPVISRELREQVAREITFKQVIKDPGAYKGRADY